MANNSWRQRVKQYMVPLDWISIALEGMTSYDLNDFVVAMAYNLVFKMLRKG